MFDRAAIATWFGAASIAITCAAMGCSKPPRATTVLSFQDLDCSDCGEEVARALIEHPRIYKTTFDKQRVELTVVAAPDVDVRALAAEAREEEDVWTLTPGAGKGHYLQTEKPPELDIVEVSRGGEDVPSLDALAVKGKVTIVDLYATWCGPCHDLDEHIVDVMKEQPGIAYRRLDVGDWDTPLGEHYLTGVKELPYVLVFRADGTRAAELVGLDLPKFDAALTAAKGSP